MKHVRVTLLSILVKEDSYYAHLGEISGKLRQLLIEIDPAAGMFMEMHIREGRCRDDTSYGVKYVLLQKRVSNLLEGTIRFLVQGERVTESLNVSLSIVCALLNKCPVILAEQVLQLKQKTLEEIYMIFPDLPAQVKKQATAGQGNPNAWQMTKTRRLMKKLDKSVGEERLQVLEHTLLDDLLMLMEVYLAEQLFEKAAEIRDTINIRCSAGGSDPGPRLIDSILNPKK